MKVTVLVDNIENNNCIAEWGLSFLIEYNNQKILLDTGSSDNFADNAKRLKINLNDVDYGVLSHAHYDHANGIDKFFEINEKAPFYIQKSTKENCYVKVLFYKRYIGIKKDLLETCKERIVYVDGNKELSKGVSIICHNTSNLKKIGVREHMYLKENNGWKPDDFSHEQSLVFECKEGLVVFNSCSHGGFLNIVSEIQKAYPGKKILAYFGGLHLFNKTKIEVIKVAQGIAETNINQIYTGHCTGDKAYNTLHEIIGDKVSQFNCGATYEFDE